MTIILGIITVIISIAQLVVSINNHKMNEFPLIEYESTKNKKVSKLASYLWKIIFFIVLVINIVIVIYGIVIYKDIKDIDEYKLIFNKIYITNIAIMYVAGIIKDIFNNIILFRKYFIDFYTKHSPNIGLLIGIAIINLFVLLLTIYIVNLLQSTKHIWICDIGLMCILSLSFCFYRAVSQAENLIYIHKITYIGIKMSDGKVYDKINYYNEDKKIVCIGIVGENTRFYLNKNQIIHIEKHMSNKTLMDTIKEKSKYKNDKNNTKS